MPTRSIQAVRRTVAAVLLFATTAAAPAAAQTAAAPDTAQREAIETIVRDYLMRNPEVILEAIEAYRDREAERQTAAASAAIAANGDALFRHPMSPESGNPDGDVTIVEFFDYQCIYCKRVMETVLDVMQTDPDLRVVWKELPILGPVSRFASEAAMAAAKQGKYLDFHIAVMGARGQLTEGRVIELAGAAGIDTGRLRKDMRDPAIGRYLDEIGALARTLGITGTPGFVIGAHLVPGAIGADQMRALIAAARQPGQ